MNKAEFIQTLSGYVPEKLIDTLAENAAWDGLFYEESESDNETSDNLSIPFPTDLADRGHRKKAQRDFKVLRAKIKNNIKDLSASSENINRPPKMIDKMVEYASRASREFPAEVRNQNSVSIKKLAEAVNNIPDFNLNGSSKICNLKLSELIYMFADKEEGD